MTFTLANATFGMVLVIFLLTVYGAYIGYSNKDTIAKAAAAAGLV